MSGSDDPEDDELIAGEYVLGVLDAAEAAAIVAEAARRPALAQAVRRWEERLAPLLLAVPPAQAPPELWQRIEASIGGIAAATMPAPVPGRQRRAKVWAWHTALAGAAFAAGVACFAVLVPHRQPTQMALMLSPAAPGAMRVVARAGGIAIQPLGTVVVPPGRDFQLWSLPAGAARPASLGVISARGTVLKSVHLPQHGVQLLISIEPKGGSPTGLPTGPIAYQAQV